MVFVGKGSSCDRNKLCAREAEEAEGAEEGDEAALCSSAPLLLCSSAPLLLCSSAPLPRWGDEFLAGKKEEEAARERSELFAKACNRRVDWQEVGHQVAVLERDGRVVVMVNGREFPCEEFLAMPTGAVEPIQAQPPSQKAKSIIERLKLERARKRSPWLFNS